jgi:hypothetical protein|tara:strand:- start:12 stop:344 length:333 start_codon:yes stop_codon:yes gene_type:complete
MSEFFQSEMVREELKVINELQQDVYGSLMNFNIMPHDEKLEHIEKLSSLLEKQKVMYTRLSLSDDPEADDMKKNLEKSLTVLGFPEGTDMITLFNGMAKTIQQMKDHLDN